MFEMNKCMILFIIISKIFNFKCYVLQEANLMVDVVIVVLRLLVVVEGALVNAGEVV